MESFFRYDESENSWEPIDNLNCKALIEEYENDDFDPKSVDKWMNSKDQIMMNSKQQKKPVVKLEKIDVETNQDGVVFTKELDHQKDYSSLKKNVNKQLVQPKGGDLKNEAKKAEFLNRQKSSVNNLNLQKLNKQHPNGNSKQIIEASKPEKSGGQKVIDGQNKFNNSNLQKVNKQQINFAGNLNIQKVIKQQHGNTKQPTATTRANSMPEKTIVENNRNINLNRLSGQNSVNNSNFKKVNKQQNNLNNVKEKPIQEGTEKDEIILTKEVSKTGVEVVPVVTRSKPGSTTIENQVDIMSLIKVNKLQKNSKQSTTEASKLEKIVRDGVIFTKEVGNNPKMNLNIKKEPFKRQRNGKQISTTSEASPLIKAPSKTDFEDIEEILPRKQPGVGVSITRKNTMPAEEEYLPLKKKTKVENTNQDIDLMEKENNPDPEKIDEVLPVPVVDKNVERASYYQMKILSSQAEKAREETKLIQQRIKIDQILGFYQFQEAMAKAKNAGYKSKASDPVYNIEI